MRTQDHPDQAAQLRQVGDPVERGTRDGRPERRVAERLPEIERAPASRRDPAAGNPAALAKRSEHAVCGGTDLRGRQQATEEQISVLGEPTAQRGRIIAEGAGIR